MTKRLVDVDDADERVEDVIHQLGVVTELVFLEPTSWKMMRSRGSRRISSGLLSDVFFEDLAIPSPDVHLGVGSGSHGVQTGAMLSALDAVLDEHQPDWTLVYGDTNSTIAAALAAVKMHLPVAHLEAGLRSFNRRMPEEHNRVLTDHAADLLLVPTQTAMGHLAREGLAERAVMVGDVMTDVCLRVRDTVIGSTVELPQGVNPAKPYVIATIHRADNTDDEIRLKEIITALRDLSAPVVLLAHPRLVARAVAFGIDLRGGALHTTTPMTYPQMVRAVVGSAGVVTDSGGLQKEAYLLGAPSTTLRTETEWIETLQDEWNIRPHRGPGRGGAAPTFSAAV